MKKLGYFNLIGAVALALWLCISFSAIAADTPQATGEHWTSASEPTKRAFLLGIATMIDIEREAQGEKPSQAVRKNSIVYDLAMGLKDYNIPSAQQAIDAWYAANPDQMARPVMEVIWFELALPNLAAK